VAPNEELNQRFFDAEDFLASPDDFTQMPGDVVAYWISDNERRAFANSKALRSIAYTKQGVATADDARFLRCWHEPSLSFIKFDANSRDDAKASGKKWFPLNKGGAHRKWYGNLEHVVNWQNDGIEIRNFFWEGGRQRSRPQNMDYYFLAGITWSRVTIGSPSFRLFGSGCVIGDKGPALYCTDADELCVLGFLNSCLVTRFLSILSPAVGFEMGQIDDLPYCDPGPAAKELAKRLVELHREDWNSSECSWDFQRPGMMSAATPPRSIRSDYSTWLENTQDRLALARELEEQNNRLFLDAYGLQGELSTEVPDDQITLYRPDREEDIKRLLSYAIGCMMGRYSLDKPGLIYAHCGNQGFDPSQYKSFRVDDDGIIPLLETDWGIRDDAANRIVEFIGVAWPKEHLEENLKFIADSLGPTSNERPRETIRRYLATGFYKHHLSMYKRRPIYWLFSSGKQRAFQCLVYLHRYHEGTLARMRTEYVIPLQGQIAARIEQLEGDKAKSTSTSHRNRLQKEQDNLKKQQAELLTFEEKLKHAAEQKISLDLDDGVKVNYAKFGDLLAESKAITGGKDEE
jgi:hypothetical protein